MASIIEGYLYDIFISYRQKDNKHDGWVTEFVNHLKGELEATFKEDISIYFDENPHDGLLETHSVDKSLEGKLKCLIFIPIISQTYCDSKCYAWQHEFCAFNKLAKEDQFGRDIKLIGGNVSSRILPVKIHDLDPEDKTLLENELGGFIRGIEFIYKEPGVNRPLKPEDDEKKNLNNTIYRNQINKVANAVKEIITALKKQSRHGEETSKEDFKERPTNQKSIRTKIIAGILFLLASIVLGYFIVPKLFKSSEPVEKSIAVLPFENLSSDNEQAWFSDGITDVIITQLSKISDLRILGRTSTLKYKENVGGKSLSEIGKELGVNYIIEGTVQRQEDKMRINVQLIRIINESHIWSNLYDREWKDIFDVQSDIAQRIAKELKTVLTPEEKGKIEKSQTKNDEAYNLYLQGRLFWYMRTEGGLQKSVEYFKKAIAVDTNYAIAYAGLADAYFIQAYWGWVPWAEGVNMSKELALKSLSINKNLAEGHTVFGALLNYSELKWEEARKEFQTAIELNPNYVTAHHYYSELLNILRQNNEARNQINLALKLDPFVPVLHALSSRYYYNDGKLKEALDECQILEELEPEYYFRSNYWLKFYIYVKQKEDLKALEALQKALNVDTFKSSLVKDLYKQSGINGLLNWLIEVELKKSNPSSNNLALWFNMLGKKTEALDWLEKTLANPNPGFASFNNNPNYENLRNDPRFQDICRKMNLPCK
jgi:TolB-like protein/Tfp pilus assembly protein PilF